MTDLFCRDHGRFLPLIRAHTSARVAMAIISSLIVYASIELTAESNSSLPVYIVYVTLSLGLVAFPLRHFTRTAVIASLIWVVADFAPVASPVIGGGHLRVILAAVTAVTGAVVFMLYAVGHATSADLPRSAARELRVISRTVAVMLIIAAWGAAAGLALRYEGYVLPGSEPGTVRVIFIAAFISLAAGALTVSTSGVVIGVRDVRWDIPALATPSRPTWVPPKLRRSSRQPYRPHNAIDAAMEALTRTIYQIAMSLANVLIIIGRLTSNCLALAAYVVAYALITLTNLVVRIAVLTARWLRATVASAARLTFYAVIVAYRRIFNAIASVVVPVAALAGAPWLALASADQTRRYLVQGSAIALRNSFILGSAATALLVSAWVILANQHPRDSLMSFGRSAVISFAYGLIILATGGLLMSAAGAAGYGHIHIGMITLILTGIVIVALIFEAARRLARSKVSAASGQPAASLSAGSRTDGHGWAVAVALVAIAGTITPMAIMTPWARLSVSRPTGLMIKTVGMTSAVIGWNAPSSGPQPDHYLITRNGSKVGSVPGTVTSYDATGLARGNSYNYQVVAIRGADRSPMSAVMTVTTRDPLLNGGFQTGTFSGWTTSGAATSIVSSGQHSGSFAAQAGSTSATNGDSNIAQTFAAATGDSTLTFWYNVTCPDTLTYDWAFATLKDNTTNTTSTVLPKTCVANSGWTQVTASITAGHSYTLTLTNHDDNVAADPTFTLFDDVGVS